MRVLCGSHAGPTLVQRVLHGLCGSYAGPTRVLYRVAGSTRVLCGSHAGPSRSYAGPMRVLRGFHVGVAGPTWVPHGSYAGPTRVPHKNSVGSVHHSRAGLPRVLQALISISHAGPMQVPHLLAKRRRQRTQGLFEFYPRRDASASIAQLVRA